MPNAETLTAFLVATAVFAYMPGPSMLYTAAQTIAHGRSAGWMAALGIHLGGYVHVIAAALGLPVLFTAVPPLYAAIKWIGSAYLIYLGCQQLRSSRIQMQPATQQAQLPARAFRQSIAVEILNPKTAVFYITFLPLFADPSTTMPLWVQLLILGTVVNIAFSSADVICVLLSTTVIRLLARSQGASHLMQRTGGVILIGLGIHLGVSQP